jgi:predicted dithiol-disulfide oxidoreductase (DUF899 family)
MNDETTSTGSPALPPVTDRASWQAGIDALRAREKAHTREGDAIAAARRQLPMVEVDASLELIGPGGPVTLLDAFEGRRQLIAYFMMWWPGRPAPDQCEGCTLFVSQVAQLAYVHSRDITFAVLSQGRNTAFGPADAQTSYEESVRYRDFMGWTMPWYSAQPSLDTLLVDREHGLFHLVCYVRDGDRVFETYWTKRRGVESMDYNYGLMDLSVYGRQEPWEDSPPGWPRQSSMRTASGPPDWSPVADNSGGRPVAQWPRLAAGHPDDLGTTIDAAQPPGAHTCH